MEIEEKSVPSAPEWPGNPSAPLLYPHYPLEHYPIAQVVSPKSQVVEPEIQVAEPIFSSEKEGSLGRRGRFHSVRDTLKSLRERASRGVASASKGTQKVFRKAQDFVGIVPESEEVKELREKLKTVENKKSYEEKERERLEMERKENEMKEQQERERLEKERKEKEKRDAVNAKRAAELTKKIENVENGVKPAGVLDKLSSLFYNVNGVYENGNTPLTQACTDNNIKGVKKLLATPGIDVNKKDIYRTTPLWSAVSHGDLEIVKVLLAVPGIDVNLDHNGKTPLWEAVRNGNLEIVKILLAVPGIDVNRKEKDIMNVREPQSPLTVAVAYNNLEIVKILLAAPGIDPREVDSNLLTAARTGRLEIVKTLLAVPGIDVNKVTGQSNLPLADAARQGHLEVVKALLDEPGIDVNKGAPLFRAVERGDLEMVKILLAAPRIDVNDRTPLAWAAHRGLLEIVKALLAAPGIDVNKKDIDGAPPLVYAAHQHNNPNKEGNLEVVKALLAAPGIDVNNTASAAWARGSTALDFARSYNQKHIEKAITDHIANEAGREPVGEAGRQWNEFIRGAPKSPGSLRNWREITKDGGKKPKKKRTTRKKSHKKKRR